MRYRVTSATEAALVTDYFNGFHDGFIRSLALTSHDTFQDRHTHVTTGRLDLEIVFAHSNYRAGVPPFDQLIEGRFFDVRDLRAVFTGLSTDWPITSLDIEPDGPRLRIRLIQPRLVGGSRWEHDEALAFTFEAGEFRELSPTRS